MSAISTAEEYNLKEIHRVFSPKLHLQFISDAVLSSCNGSLLAEGKEPAIKDGDLEMFIFKNGTFVTWGFTEGQFQAVKKTLKAFERKSTALEDYERMTFTCDDSQR